MNFSTLQQLFTIFVLSLLAQVFCRPASKPCYKDIDSKHAVPLLKGLQENKFRILDILDIKTAKPIGPFEDLTSVLAKKIFDKKNTKPICEVKYEKDTKKHRFPKVIIYAKLVNRKDLTHCRPIRRTITYFERNKECNEKLQQHLYAIRKVSIVVAYQAMEKSD